MVNNAESRQRKTKRIKLPEHIPKSIVVHRDDLTMLHKVKLLNLKYIHVGSKFELNISGGLRHLTLAKFKQMSSGQLDEEEGIYIFDEVKNSILKLMNDSF